MHKHCRTLEGVAQAALDVIAEQVLLVGAAYALHI